MNDIDYHQVIKWVIIVVIAGFLGQFGKMFATYLIEKARKKKALVSSEKAGGPVESEEKPPAKPESPGTAEAGDKAAKKALKAAIKLKKKGG